MNKIKNHIFREKINESESSGQSSTERKLTSLSLVVKSKAIFLQNWQEARKWRYLINIHVMRTPYFIATKTPVTSSWRINLKSWEKRVWLQRLGKTVLYLKEWREVGQMSGWWLIRWEQLINLRAFPWSRQCGKCRATPLPCCCRVPAHFSSNPSLPVVLIFCVLSPLQTGLCAERGISSTHGATPWDLSHYYCSFSCLLQLFFFICLTLLKNATAAPLV